MTTREFITQAWYGNTKRTTCSSVFADSNGNIFSYGYHYPLLFTLNGKAIRNVRGYSSTTQRHIMWSRDVNAIDVVAPRGFRLNGSDDELLQQLIDSQRAHVDSIKREMDTKKRKDTNVYRWLEHDFIKATKNLGELLA